VTRTSNLIGSPLRPRKNHATKVLLTDFFSPSLRGESTWSDSFSPPSLLTPLFHLLETALIFFLFPRCSSEVAARQSQLSLRLCFLLIFFLTPPPSFSMNSLFIQLEDFFSVKLGAWASRKFEMKCFQIPNPSPLELAQSYLPCLLPVAPLFFLSARSSPALQRTTDSETISQKTYSQVFPKGSYSPRPPILFSSKWGLADESYDHRKTRPSFPSLPTKLFKPFTLWCFYRAPSSVSFSANLSRFFF